MVSYVVVHSYIYWYSKDCCVPMSNVDHHPRRSDNDSAAEPTIPVTETTIIPYRNHRRINMRNRQCGDASSRQLSRR